MIRPALCLAAALNCANFLLILPVQAQDVSDDFNDNSRNDLLWTEDPGPGQSAFVERNGRLEFINPAENGESYANLKLERFPSYDEGWTVMCVGWMDESVFSAVGQSSLIGISVGNTSGTIAGGDEFLDLTVGAGVFEAGEPPVEGIVSTSQFGNQEERQILDVRPISGPAGLRMTYDPDLKAFRLDYNLDAGFPDSSWQLHRIYTVNGSSIAGEDHEMLDWQMTESDLFVIHLTGSVSSIVLDSGTAWLDDFEFAAGGTGPAEPPVLSIAFVSSGNGAGMVELRVEDANHAGITIQSSEDLNSWAAIGGILPQENATRFETQGTARYFRAFHE